MKNMPDDRDFLKHMQRRLLKAETEADEMMWSKIQHELEMKRQLRIIGGRIVIILISFLISFSVSDQRALRTFLSADQTLSFSCEHNPPRAVSVNKIPPTEPIVQAASHSPIFSVDTRTEPSSMSHAKSPQRIYRIGRSLAENKYIKIDDPDPFPPSLIQSPIKERVFHSNKKVVHLYASLNPSLHYQIIDPLKSDEVKITAWSKPGVLSSQRLAIALEGGVVTPIGKRWEVFSGINYFLQHRHITYDYVSRSASYAEVKDGTVIIKPETRTQRLNYSMSTIGIQGGIMYLFKEGKLMHKAGVSLLYQFGLKGATSENLYLNKQSSYLFTQLHYRFEWQKNKQISFYIQPSLAFAILEREKLTAPFHLTRYYTTFGLGAIYHLNFASNDALNH